MAFTCLRIFVNRASNYVELVQDGAFLPKTRLHLWKPVCLRPAKSIVAKHFLLRGSTFQQGWLSTHCRSEFIILAIKSKSCAALKWKQEKNTVGVWPQGPYCQPGVAATCSVGAWFAARCTFIVFPMFFWWLSMINSCNFLASSTIVENQTCDT